MTKAFSILHRAAALLVALCLLVGMALPVYAAEDEALFFDAGSETIPTVTTETTAEESTEPEQNPVVTDSETVPDKENTRRKRAGNRSGKHGKQYSSGSE